MGVKFIKQPPDPYLNDVSLLLHMDGNFIDSSLNNFTVTAFGNAQTSSAQKKFGTGSALFDGNGDYLSTNQITLDTQDFTLECWIYLTTYGSQNNTIFNQGNTDNTGAFLVLIGSATNDRKLIFYANNFERFRGTTTIPLNTWTNITVTRQSNIYYFFINGVLEGTHSATYNHNQAPFKIGDGYGGVRYFNGYIDELRVTKGIARYTTNFVPSTQPFGGFSNSKYTFSKISADPNTSLLLHMDGTNGSQSFIDSSANNFAITANGNAQISTSIKKFGTGAGYFAYGDSSYLESEPSSEFGLGTEDFTIEMWLYKDTGITNWNGFFCINRYDDDGILIRVQTVFDSLYIGGEVYDWYPSTHFPLNQWNHFAFVRNSGVIKIYINGTEVFTANNSNNLGSTGIVTVGASSHSYGEGFGGYIDEVRVIKGQAKYITNFTPPTSPFSLIGDPSTSKYRFIKAES
jgi:hypothetical protein